MLNTLKGVQGVTDVRCVKIFSRGIDNIKGALRVLKVCIKHAKKVLGYIKRVLKCVQCVKTKFQRGVEGVNEVKKRC